MKINKFHILSLFFALILSSFFASAKQLHFCHAPPSKIGTIETLCEAQACVKIHYTDQNTCLVELITVDSFTHNDEVLDWGLLDESFYENEM